LSLVKRQVHLLLGLRLTGEEELVSWFRLPIEAVVPLARDEASPATKFDQHATSAQLYTRTKKKKGMAPLPLCHAVAARTVVNKASWTWHTLKVY